MANLTNSQEPEPGVFGSLEPEPLDKKPGAGAAWEKNQEPEPEPELLEKKVRSWSRSRKKICRLPSPGIMSNIYLFYPFLLSNILYTHLHTYTITGDGKWETYLCELLETAYKCIIGLVGSLDILSHSE